MAVRELTPEEVQLVSGGVAPLLFVGAVALSQVSWANVAFWTGAMVGGGGYAMMRREVR